MAQDRGENALAVESVERIGVGVADARRHDFDQHFARLRPFQIDFDDFQRLLCLESDGGTRFQFNSPEEFDCLVYHKRRFRDNKANRNF
jgi:hypothetical protein